MKKACLLAFTPFALDATSMSPLLDLEHPELGRHRDLCSGFIPMANGCGLETTAHGGYASEYVEIQVDVASSQVAALVATRVRELDKPLTAKERRQLKDAAYLELAACAALKKKHTAVIAFPHDGLMLIEHAKPESALSIARCWFDSCGIPSESLNHFLWPEELLSWWAGGKFLPTDSMIGSEAELILADGTKVKLSGHEVQADNLSNWLARAERIERLAIRFAQDRELVVGHFGNWIKIKPLRVHRAELERIRREVPAALRASASRDFEVEALRQLALRIRDSVGAFGRRPQLVTA